jgi:hypothetical protein
VCRSSYMTCSSQRQRETRSYWAVPLVLLVFLLVPLGCGLWHHHDSALAAKCQVCHAGQVVALSSSVQAQLPVPVVVAWAEPAGLPNTGPDPLFIDGPSRAPPA